MTDEDHTKRINTQSRLRIKSDVWRAQGNQLEHNEDKHLNPSEKDHEMKQAKAEMRHLLDRKFDHAEERMVAAEIASRGRPISSRILAEEMVKEIGSKKASTYAAAASLSGFGR